MFVGPEPVSVELTLYTDSLTLRGTITTHQRRVTDILNMAEGPFLILDGVTIQEHGLRGQQATASFAQINLDAILFATADIPVEANPAMRIAKTAERAVVSVPPFKVAGDVHLVVGDGDVRQGLGALTDNFVPVTDATFWSDQLDEGRRQALLVAVNHRRAHYISPHREVDPWADLSAGSPAGEDVVHPGDGAMPPGGEMTAPPGGELGPAEEA